MTETGRATAGPIRLTSSSVVALRPATQARITGGLWAGPSRGQPRRLRPRGLGPAARGRQLPQPRAGRRRRVTGDYVSDLPVPRLRPLQVAGGASAWTLDDPDLAQAAAPRSCCAALAESTELLAAAQQEDGYLDSHFQVRFPGERFVQLPWGHELYCAGHLIQAAVALHRSTGDDAAAAASPAGSPTSPSAPSAPARAGRRRLRPPRDRDGAGRALPGDRRALLPRPRASTSSTGAATACWATTGSAGTTGRTTCPCARPRRPRATRSASSTCWPAWPTSTSRPATPALLRRRRAALDARWSRRRPT